MPDKATLKSYFETGDMPTQAQFEALIDEFYGKTDDPEIGANSHAKNEDFYLDQGGANEVSASEIRNFLDAAKNIFQVQVSTTEALPVTASGGVLTSTSNQAFTLAGNSWPLGTFVLVKDGPVHHLGIYGLTQLGGASQPYKLTRLTNFNTDEELHQTLVVSKHNNWESVFLVTVNASYVSAPSGKLNDPNVGVTVQDVLVKSNTQSEGDIMILANNGGQAVIPAGGSETAMSSFGIENKQGVNLSHSAGEITIGKTGFYFISLPINAIVTTPGDDYRTGVRLKKANAASGGAYTVSLLSGFQVTESNSYVALTGVFYLEADDKLKVFCQPLEPNTSEVTYSLSLKGVIASWGVAAAGGVSGGTTEYIATTGQNIDLASNKIINSFDAPGTQQPAWINVSGWAENAHAIMYVQLNTDLQIPVISDASIKWRYAKETNVFTQGVPVKLDIVKTGNIVTVGVHAYETTTPLSNVQITGGTAEGATLTAEATFNGVGTEGTREYQWVADGVDVPGATSSTYSGQSEGESVKVKVKVSQTIGGKVIPGDWVESAAITVTASGGGGTTAFNAPDTHDTGDAGNVATTQTYAQASFPQSANGGIVYQNSGAKSVHDFNYPAGGSCKLRFRVRLGSSNVTNYAPGYGININGGAQLEEGVGEGLDIVGTQVFDGSTPIGSVYYGWLETQNAVTLNAGANSITVGAINGYALGAFFEFEILPQ